MPLLYTVIASGQSVSADVNLTTYSLRGIGVPVVTSGDLFIQGNWDTTSAGFTRLLETRSPTSGDLRFATGPGSRMIMWDVTMPSPPYIRLETAVAQTSVATFTLLVSRW